jgi:hypothetical protein
MVIDKAGAGYTDALNCGVNVARYRYFMPVAPDVTFDREALLRLMTAALRDPANLVGASPNVERGADSVGKDLGGTHYLRALFHRLASARSPGQPSGLKTTGAGLRPAGAVNIGGRMRSSS